MGLNEIWYISFAHDSSKYLESLTSDICYKKQLFIQNSQQHTRAEISNLHKIIRFSNFRNFDADPSSFEQPVISGWVC